MCFEYYRLNVMNDEGTTEKGNVRLERKRGELEPTAAESHLVLFRIGAAIHNHQPAALEAGLDAIYYAPLQDLSDPTSRRN